MKYAERTMQHIYTIWGRPVHLETVVAGHAMVLKSDGDQFERKSL